MSKVIYIIPEYDGGTIRSYKEDGLSFFDPEDLPLEQETIARFHAWDDSFQATYREDDPKSSGFASEQAEEAWKKEGVKLWQQIQHELEPEYEVLYRFYYNGKRYVLKDLNELPDDLKEWLKG